MQSKFFALAAGAALALSSLAAEAMPLSAPVGASTAPEITQVAEGCGPGFARGPAGGCRRIVVRRAVVVRRPVVVRPVRPRCGIHVPGVTVVTRC